LRRSLLKLFPAANAAVLQIRYAFAGIRPLPFTRGEKLGAITRNHILHDHSDDGAAGMISVIGGKLTTAGQLARQCAAKLGLPVSSSPVFAIAGMSALETSSADQLAQFGIATEAAHAIFAWHPFRLDRLVSAIRERPQLAAPLCEHSTHIVAEAVDAFEFQYATTLADVLLRRVPVALGPCWDASCTRIVADRVGNALGWTDHRIGLERENFEQEHSAFLIRR